MSIRALNKGTVKLREGSLTALVTMSRPATLQTPPCRPSAAADCRGPARVLRAAVEWGPAGGADIGGPAPHQLLR